MDVPLDVRARGLSDGGKPLDITGGGVTKLVVTQIGKVNQFFTHIFKEFGRFSDSPPEFLTFFKDWCDFCY